MENNCDGNNVNSIPGNVSPSKRKDAGRLLLTDMYSRLTGLIAEGCIPVWG